MSIYENVIGVLKEKEKTYENNPDYRKLFERYQDLLKRGLIKKQEYEIPPIDTIGKRQYQVEEKEE